MKALKTKVMLSAFVLLFALVATIGSTYAWFTVSSTVSVSSITLNVQSQDSLLIKVAAPTAVDADSSSNTTPAAYFSTLTEAQILATYGSIATAYLKPVTAIQTGYATVDGDVLKPLSAIEGNPTRTLGTALDLNLVDGSSDINATGGGVIQMRFWVMSQGEADQDLYLSALSFVNGGGNSPAQDAAINAIRLAVFAGDFGAGPTSYIYGNDVDYDFAFLSGQAGYFSGTTYTGSTLNGFNALSQIETLGYDGLASNGDEIADYTVLTGHYTVNDSTDVISVLSQNVPQLITVTIFLEGWDAETTNDLMLANFDISFSFAIVEHVA